MGPLEDIVDLKEILEPQADTDEVILEQSKSPSKKRGRSRRRAKQEESEKPRRLHVLWDFRFEFLALILFGLGVFLLLEKFKIRTWLYGLVLEGFAYAKETAVWMLGTTSAIEKSDIVGIVLLVSAVVLIGYDIRTRVLRRHEEIESEPLCGKCGKQMRRIHGSRLQQGLATVFRVRIKRFLCTKCTHRLSVWRHPHESDW